MLHQVILSNFDEALIVTMDAVGEWTTTSIMIGKNDNIEFKEEINFPHSLVYCTQLSLTSVVLK